MYFTHGAFCSNARTVTPGLSTDLLKLVVTPKKSGITARWSCTSIDATGSNFDEKLNSVKLPRFWRRPGTFTWWPSMSLIELTYADGSRWASLNANERFQSIFASAFGSAGEP